MSITRIVRHGIVVTAAIALWVAPAAAQEDFGPHNEIRVRILGGSTRFSPPMRDVAALRAMATTNRDAIARVFSMVGLADISDKAIEALTAGNVTEATIGTNTHLDWMALKRRGTPDVLRNVRWAGRSSFDAFQFKIEHAGYTYTLVVPKVCGNLSLVSKVASPVTRTAEFTPPPPPPPPPAPRAPEPEPIAPEPPPPPPPVPVSQAAPAEKEHYDWVATGFVGANLTANVDFVESDDSDPTINYGFQLSYMRHQRFGAEFLADFGPSVGIDSAGSTLLFEDSHSVNAYMLNIIGGLPFSAGRFTPYWSAGAGIIQFRGDVVDFNGDSEFESNGKFGWNLGVGLITFAGHWGLRTDLRYFRANTDDAAPDLTSTEEVSKSLVSGLTFWRANAGLAVRW